MDMVVVETGLRHPLRDTIHVAYLPRYLALVHARNGWQKDRMPEVQANSEFHFDGHMLRAAVRAELGFTLDRVYFPAAYSGRVAKALSFSGSKVFASDLSSYWVRKLHESGLDAHRRSFEDVPAKGEVDAVVCFEPYPVPEFLKFLAVLRLMARGIPLIEIYREREGNGGSSIKASASISGSSIALSDRVEGIAAEYGAIVRLHSLGDRFRFYSVMSTPKAAKNALVSLRVLSQLGNYPFQSGRITIGELNVLTGNSRQDVITSLNTLSEIFSDRFMFRSAYNSKDPVLIAEILGILGHLSESDAHSLIQKIRIDSSQLGSFSFLPFRPRECIANWNSDFREL